VSVSAAIRKSRPIGITVIGLWTLVGSAAVLAFAVIVIATSGYPIAGLQTLFVLVMLDLLVAGPAGYLFYFLSLPLAALGIYTGLGTLYGRRWARWLNVVLSGIVMYQGAMLFSTAINHPQVASSWTFQDWAVPTLFLAANGARIWYVLFSSEARTYFN
jgi:hypothetical protein